METVRRFLLEIPIQEPYSVELERATLTLLAAESRLRREGTLAAALITASTSDSGRLVCLIEASTSRAARRLVALALLPAGRLREVSDRLVGAGPLGARDPDPVPDLGSGAESELVEDVVDVGFDGSLGDE